MQNTDTRSEAQPITFAEDFAFCMAHHLPTFPEGHKCRNIHGHTCVLTVLVAVAPGRVLDHALLREAVTPVVRTLCHAGVINDISPMLSDGTSESQLRWFWGQIWLVTRTLDATLIELEHAEASAPGGVLLWHRKSYRGPSL